MTTTEAFMAQMELHKSVADKTRKAIVDIIKHDGKVCVHRIHFANITNVGRIPVENCKHPENCAGPCSPCSCPLNPFKV